jgi:pimeloyl-ACP methyl ester carboxylesterase
MTTTIQTKTSTRLSYRKEGQGPALVLIHGFPENGGLWKQVWPILAVNFTIIVPDLPGTGASDLTADVSMDSLAQNINEILAKEEINEAVIVGHSMGGYAALALAEKYPDIVKGLSLVHSIASADNEEKKETRRKSIALIRKGGKEPFIRQMIPNLFSPTFKAGHPSVIEQQVKRGMELEADSMIAFYEAMIARPDRTNILKNASFPVQFIIGQDDAVIPPGAAVAQSRLSNRNFVSLYTDTGHMSMIENAERLSKDVTEFANYCFGV